MNRSPNWTRTFVLVLILFGLGLTTWWLQFQHKPQQETQAENAKKPFALPKGTTIASIRVETGPRAFALKCLGDAGQACKVGNNSKWELEQPLKVRADDTNANALVSALDRLQATEIFDLKDETPEKRAAILKEYGLSPEDLKGPNMKKIEVKTAGAGTWIAYFGGSHPINEGLFTVVEQDAEGKPPSGQPDGTHVFLTPSFFKTNFEHNLTFWRDKKVLGINASEIQSFRLEGKLGSEATSTKAGATLSTKPTWIEGEKKGGNWTLRTPEGEFAGDIENIDSMLSGAAFLVAKDIVDENKNSIQSKEILKGSHPLLTLALRKAQGPNEKETPTPIILSLSEKGGEKGAEKKTAKKSPLEGPNADLTRLYATVSNLDPLFELQNGARNQIGKSLKDLRLSKLITSVDRFGAKKLEFTSKALGATPLTLSGEAGKWTQSDGTVVSDQKIQATLDKLSGGRVREFLPAAQTPTGEADGTQVTLWTDTANGAAPKRHLVFWKNGGKLYARDLLSSSKDAFLVDMTIQDGLPSDRAFYKATAPSPGPKTQSKK
jgi:hypothetical protein